MSRFIEVLEEMSGFAEYHRVIADNKDYVRMGQDPDELSFEKKAQAVIAGAVDAVTPLTMDGLKNISEESSASNPHEFRQVLTRIGADALVPPLAGMIGFFIAKDIGVSLASAGTAKVIYNGINAVGRTRQ